jgi:hypothetical protein
MMNIVYICTRARINNLKKVVPRWLAQGFKVVLVIESGVEFRLHEDLREEMDWSPRNVWLQLLSERDMGIGYSRAEAIDHAHSAGLKSIIMSDDDIRPAPESDMSLLIQEAEKPNILGVGAALRIQDHYTKGAVSANSGVILCPGSWGGRLYGLNIANTLACGNFDSLLDCFGEDDELKRRGIADLSIPWAVHCSVWAESIGARYQSGGVQALVGKDRIARELRCHETMHERWPQFVSKPPKPYRTSWQKMLDNYIYNWRSRSAMHGGAW